MTATISISERFCGPPGAANGGYVCGLLADALPDGDLEMTIRRPVPLGRPLAVEWSDRVVTLRDGEQVLVEGVETAWAVEPPPAPTLAEAEAAQRGFPRFESHPLPRCFACGTEREPGDGLRIFPGPVPGRETLWAAVWRPHPSLAGWSGRVRREILFAALDCAGAFAVNEPPRGLALLGRFAARVLDAPEVNEPLVVASWEIARDGRKLFPGTAIFDAAGRLRAVARATWILTRPDPAPVRTGV